MKKLHYQNIGHPKTGTTWVYHQLLYHPQVDCKPDLNYKEYDPHTKEDYLNFYKDYDISFNLRTLTFLNPQKLHHATHISCTFRNLFDLLNTWYNYLHYNPNYNTSMNDFLSLNDYNFKLITDVEKIFEQWKDYDVKWLFYDDLAADNKSYLHSICDYLGLERYYDPRIKVKFKTNITKQILFDDENIIKYINDKIKIIEDHTHRDLTHWKK
jgi:hypothetical protein